MFQQPWKMHMFTAWEEKVMRKVLSVIYYEYAMQLKRIATWGVLAGAVVISLLDSFPSAKNIARLEFLEQPSYFINRTLSFGALIMVFGLMFLLSNNITIPFIRYAGYQNRTWLINKIVIIAICTVIWTGICSVYGKHDR